MSLKVERLRALEILDSRGRPTVEVEATLSDGTVASAQVPSGASTGRHEALELRDRDHERFGGEGTLKACRNVEQLIAPEVAGMDAEDQGAIDAAMIELDGTPDKSRLGANAVLGVSCAVARAAAGAQKLPLWEYMLGQREASLPIPMVNILSGGLHAFRNIEFQDFLAIPHGLPTFSEALEALWRIHRTTYEIVTKRGYTLTGMADEGGWGPVVERNEINLEILTEAIERAGYRPADQVSIAVDVASSHFFEDGTYHLASEGRSLDADEMVELFIDWCERYPVISIEDGLDQDDWDGWRSLTVNLGDSVQILGDDLFTTNPERLERGIQQGAANAILVKMNQIGTLSETFYVIDRALEGGFLAVISTRSGETEDSFLADLAVASGAGQIKPGSLTRSERLAKFNRILAIERDSGLAFPANDGF
jgi:enolase